MSADLLVRPAPTGRRPRRSARPHLALPLPVALLVAAAAGLVYRWAFPAPNVWVLAFVGVGGVLVALRGRGFWSGALTGFVFGLAFWLTLIDWLTLFLGPIPLLALGVLQALLVAAGAGLIALAYRAVPLLWPDRWGRLVLVPLVVAAAWTSREVVAGTWPYGGFAWGRFSLSQSTSPFAPLAAWFGLSGLSFLLVWLTAVGVALITEPRRDFAALKPDRAASVLPRLLVAALLPAVVLLGIPSFPISVTGFMRIAAVQPDTHAGYFDPKNDPQQNLEATVRATGAAVGQGVDLVVWPEGAAMFDPFRDPGVQQQLEVVARGVGAPLLTGAITERDGVDYNTSLLWVAGAGIVEWYDKVHPVPFAEYVPDRAFWTPFAPSLLAMIGRDYAIGQRSPVIDVGRAKVGVDICFDIVDDGLILGSVQDGAQLLVGQTNNADFGETDEHDQQLAIARLRAIETGRAMVTASTVASTTAIAPDGSTIAASKPFTPQTVIAEVPLANGITPAVAFGVALGATIALLGALLPLIASLLARPLARRGA
ncbi:apolipoprotein N-acyltransferase [Amnibacterium endophyticum]|uniref:Apolipoprotein N-acyltransferase n=1 Tax=Amnibacterium endophyticum TaxID=2109337 RepID=A0ABW4LHP4_9MICO